MKGLIACLICTASSVVGAKIIKLFGSPLVTFSSVGKAYANVFPVPVLANAIQLSPSLINWLVSCWIKVGFVKPNLVKTVSISFFIIVLTVHIVVYTALLSHYMRALQRHFLSR